MHQPPLRIPRGADTETRLAAVVWAGALNQAARGPRSLHINTDHLAAEDTEDVLCAVLTALTTTTLDAAVATSSSRHRIAAMLLQATHEHRVATELVAVSTATLDMLAAAEWGSSPRFAELEWQHRRQILQASAAFTAALRPGPRPRAVDYGITGSRLVYLALLEANRQDALQTYSEIRTRLDDLHVYAPSASPLRVAS